MRRSAAPSVIAKKRQDQEKENVAESKSNVCGKVSIGRKKFKSPVANSIGLVVDPSALTPRSEVELGSCRSEGFVVKDAPFEGRNSSQVLKLINSGRVRAEGHKATTASDNVVNRFANSVPSSGLDSMPDFEAKSKSEAENLESSSMTNLKFNSSLSESSSTVGVKRSFPEDGGLANQNLDIARKMHHSEGESLLEGKRICIEEVPAISKETIHIGEPEILHLNVPCSGLRRDDPTGLMSESPSSFGVKRSCPEEGGVEKSDEDITRKDYLVKEQGESPLGRKNVSVEEVPAILEEIIVNGEPEIGHLNVIPDPDDLYGRLESTSSEVKRGSHLHVKEEHDNGVISKLKKSGTVLHGSQRQRPSLHDINAKVASKPCQEMASAEYYTVMYCPRKPNTKRKGPWSDGVIICQGRSCTLQDLDGKAVTKSIVQGLKDMPEGATLEVGKFEIEVLRKASSEEVLSGTLYLVDKTQPVPKELQAPTTKKQTFKSFKLQQSG